MNKKRFFRILFALALVAALTTSVYAYMFHKTQTVKNVFTPAIVTCDIEETFTDNVKSSITVKNTGNVDAYLRVRLVFHWEDSRGYPVARDISSVDHAITYDSEKWLYVGDDTYYYRTPVAPGEFTSNLFAENFTFEMNAISVTEDISGQTIVYEYYPVMEVLAEAIQADPATAEDEAWNKIS